MIETKDTLIASLQRECALNPDPRFRQIAFDRLEILTVADPDEVEEQVNEATDKAKIEARYYAAGEFEVSREDLISEVKTLEELLDLFQTFGAIPKSEAHAYNDLCSRLKGAITRVADVERRLGETITEEQREHRAEREREIRARQALEAKNKATKKGGKR